MAAVTVVVINPAELMARARDTTRATELNSIHRNLGLYIATVPSPSLGLPNTVYISLPDTSSTCASWTGLAPLPSGWSYRCVTSANLRRTNGTGWIPVNFDASAGGSPFAALPIDPINNVSHYYTYVTGGSWALSALLESERRLREQANKDGGFNPGKFEVGTNLRLIALSEGLVGWWPFEEGSGTTTRDASKTGNTGTLLHGPTWQPPANCKQGRCLSFDGVDDRVEVPFSTSLDIRSAITIEVWMNPREAKSVDPVRRHAPFTNQILANRHLHPHIHIAGIWYALTSRSLYALNRWTHYVFTYDSTTRTMIIYLDGVEDNRVRLPDGLATYDLTHATSPLTIGTAWAGSLNYLNGILDEVRIYNRALSASEIAAIYAATK